MNALQLGTAIKKLRSAQGVKGYEFAKKVGITGEYLSEIENGKKLTTLKVSIRISEELQVKLSDLILFAERQPDRKKVQPFTEVERAKVSKALIDDALKM